MASQRDPNRYAVMCYVPIELAAKIKSYVYGKTVVNKHREGEKVHTPTRPMAMSDLLIALAEAKLKDQEVLPQFRQWADATKRRNTARRTARLTVETQNLTQGVEKCACCCGCGHENVGFVGK